jgi:hypothetical protein
MKAKTPAPDAKDDLKSLLLPEVEKKLGSSPDVRTCIWRMAIWFSRLSRSPCGSFMFHVGELRVHAFDVAEGRQSRP